MATDVSICSRVLVMLGESPAQSLTEPRDAVRTVAAVYDDVKKELLSQYPWRWAMNEAALNASPDAPIKRWERAFILPPDMIGQPVAVYLDGSETASPAFEVYGKRLFANARSVAIDYVVNQREADFPAWFTKLLVYALAAEVAFPITDQQSTSDAMRVEAFGNPSEGGMGGLMGIAVTNDAQGSETDAIDTSAFVTAWQGGGW